MILDEDGFPHRAEEKSGKKIVRTINTLSHRSEQKGIPFWRLFYLLHPRFLGLTVSNYARYCAVNGIRDTLRIMLRGIKQQAGAHGN
ncbi:hypothetical protein JXO59_08625 [candidate division KSB1 bacterium]|nr:hypothetical protein [candidate division KSB1 bacterium]